MQSTTEVRVFAWGMILVSLPLLALGCSSSSSLGDGGGGQGGSAGNGGQGGTGGGAGEFEACLPLAPNCGDLTCVSFGTQALCVETCTLDGDSCAEGRRCVPQPDEPTQGYCGTEIDDYAPCVDDVSKVCSEHALCLALQPQAPSRCLPVCLAGTLAVSSTVSTCPDTILGEVACTEITLGDGSGSTCSVSVTVGAPCDDGVLNCDRNQVRPDTDEVNEAQGENGEDPGALACLPAVDSGATCVRVCAADGVSGASCECPVGDSGCTDPTDSGLSWQCVRWDNLSAGVSACQPVEDCSSSAEVCADNLGSNLTLCADSPYADGPSKICQAP